MITDLPLHQVLNSGAWWGSGILGILFDIMGCARECGCFSHRAALVVISSGFPTPS